MVWFLIDLNVFDSLLGLVNEPILEEIIFKISSRTSIFFKLFLLTISLIYVSVNRLFKYDILDWDANKRKKALKIMQNLNEIKLGLRLIKEDAETDYTIDKALEDIDKEIQELKDIATKYDYSKLPKDI